AKQYVQAEFDKYREELMNSIPLRTDQLEGELQESRRVNSERVDAYFIASLVSDGVIDESRLEDADGNPRPPEQVLESVDVTRPGLYEGFDYESDNAERNGDDLFWIDKDDRTDKNERYYNRDAGQYANIYADWNFYGYEHYI